MEDREKDQRQHEPSFVDDETRVNAAVVCTIALEQWPEIRRRIRELGGDIHFQMVVPRRTFLKIVEEPMGAP